MGTLRVAVDVGGTFTDICILDEDGGEIEVGKVPSTSDPIDAVVAGVVDAGVDMKDVVLFSHGTTVATNALITRNLPPAAMVTTEHFRDVIEIRRGTKADLWDAYADVAPPYIRRRDRFEVAERIDHAGEVVTPLDEEMARRVAAVLRRRGIQTVAVCFINAHANPVHELRMREILEEELPGRERLDVGGGPARDLRARALLHNRGERRPLPSHLRLRQPAAGPPRLAGVRRRRAAPPLRRRRDDAEAGGALRGAPRRLGHRGGRDRQPPHCHAVRVSERDRLRHGRHVHRRLPRLPGRGASDEGVVRRVRLSDLLPLDRGAHDRRGRRVLRLDRRGRVTAQRTAVRRRQPGPGMLRPRQRQADEHRCQPRARASWRKSHRRCDGARPGCLRAGHPRARRGAAGARPRRGCGRGDPGGEREHGRCRPADLDPARLRPAGVLPGRLRRRRPPARRGARRGAVDPDGAGAAQPGHHVRPRLPARRRPPRPVGDVPRARGGRRQGCPGSRVRATRGRRAGAPVGGERPRGADVTAAPRRHALPRPVALADGGRVGSRRPGRGSRPLPRRARAGLQLPPRRRAGRDLPPRASAPSA